LTYGAILDAAATTELLEIAQRRHYERGAALFTEGDRSVWTGLICRGRVKLASVDLDGRETVLAVLSHGELLGELAAVDGEPRGATATALDEVELAIVQADDFAEFLRTHGDVGLAVLRAVSQRLRQSSRRQADLGVVDIGVRVARVLVEMAERFGDNHASGVRVALPLTQSELASWVGASRETTVRALRRLREQGLIDTGRREVRVVDLDALRAAAI
jgi:CRP/FNR family transcriptional regulator, cyclic AMP receptor protein